MHVLEMCGSIASHTRRATRYAVVRSILGPFPPMPSPPNGTQRRDLKSGLGGPHGVGPSVRSTFAGSLRFPLGFSSNTPETRNSNRGVAGACDHPHPSCVRVFG